MTTQIERPAANTLRAPDCSDPFLPETDIDTTAVPFRMADGVHIPAERYYEQSFADLENTKMWMHTWQWAARVEDVPNIGDYIEYTVVEETVMVVRVDADTIKVMRNVCPHRATKLVEDCGTFGGGQIVCPFHGWRWKLNGDMSYLYGRHGFVEGSVDPAIVNLPEVRSEIKYGFVWINFDNEAPSFDEFIAPIDENVAPLAIERMRMRWWKYAVVPANWKITLEAFMEAYHVMQAHPEIAMGGYGDDYDPDHTTYTIKGNGHVSAGGAVMKPGEQRHPAMPGIEFGEWFLEMNRVMFEGTDAYTTIREDMIGDRIRNQDLADDKIIPTYMQEFHAYCKDAGIELPAPDPKASGYAYMFPNFVFLGTTGNLLFYRVRPNGTDPNSCIYEVFALQIPTPEGYNLPPVRPEGPLEVKDWPFVLRQDMENVTRQQAGYRSKGFKQAVMSPRYEPMIYAMHNEIDRYIAK